MGVAEAAGVTAWRWPGGFPPPPGPRQLRSRTAYWNSAGWPRRECPRAIADAGGVTPWRRRDQCRGPMRPAVMWAASAARTPCGGVSPRPDRARRRPHAARRSAGGPLERRGRTCTAIVPLVAGRATTCTNAATQYFGSTRPSPPAPRRKPNPVALVGWPAQPTAAAGRQPGGPSPAGRTRTLALATCGSSVLRALGRSLAGGSAHYLICRVKSAEWVESPTSMVHVPACTPSGRRLPPAPPSPASPSPPHPLTSVCRSPPAPPCPYASPRSPR